LPASQRQRGDVVLALHLAQHGPASIVELIDALSHQRMLALRATAVAQRRANCPPLPNGDNSGRSDWVSECSAYRRAMASKHTLFRIFYRLGFTPWDGHPLAQSLQSLIEGHGAPALPAATALELGCGTGDCSIYLAKHGWIVTAVDFVPKALTRARAKASAAGLSVDFIRADVTQLSQAGIGANFALIVDNGCLHNMSDSDRDSYVREVSAVAAPDARLLIVAFVPGGRLGVRGVDRTEMERRFSPGWTLLSAGDERELDRAEKTPARYYLFQRAG
jgi:SAM-dependent methyltransferase